MGRRFGRLASVTVLSDECDEGGGGRALGVGTVGEVGEARGSSSGLAMRRPPNDWDRLRSPFMMEEGRGAATAVRSGRGSSDRRAEAALQGGRG